MSHLPEYFMGMNIMSDWGALSLPSTVKPEFVDEVLLEGTVRNVHVDGIKVKICGKTGRFEQALCEVAVFVLVIVSQGIVSPTCKTEDL